MNKLPFVTIIIPYKNNLDYLFIALKSIFNQSYKNFKILIVYDDEDKSDLSKIKKENYEKFDLLIYIDFRNYFL